MQDQINEIRRAMKPVAQTLTALGVPYAVVGSVAGLSHGYSRFTMDVDTVAFLTEDIVEEFVKRLQPHYYIYEPAVREAIRHHRSFNLICNENAFKIDIFVPQRIAWQLQVVARVEDERMEGVEEPAFVIESAEDLVLSKLRWFRQTNETSERQWSDVLGVLKMNCFDIDTEYLEHWAIELRVDDLLMRALDESGIKPIEGNE